MATQLTRWLVFLLPALVFLGLFTRSLDYAFVWTDQGEIVSGGMILPPGQIASTFIQPMLGHRSSEGQPYYRPLHVAVASLIDDQLGRTPRSYRSVAIVLGALNAALICAFAFSLTRRLGAALATGLIYVTHPVLIESHVWIAALSQSLSTLFLIPSLWVGVTAIRHFESDRRGSGLALMGISSVLLVAGLMSKESVVVGPVLLACCWVAVVLQRSEAERPPLRDWFGRAPGSAICAVCAQALVVGAYVGVWRPMVIGASLAGYPPLGGNLQAHWLTAVASWPTSIAWILFPHRTSTSDIVRIAVSPFDGGVLESLLIVALSIAACLALARRGHGVAALGLAWIWIAFLPTSGLVPLTHMRATRYVYLSSIGFALFVPALLDFALARLRDNPRQWAMLGGSVLLAGWLAERTWERTPDWRSDSALFSADIESDPHYVEGHHMLAVAQATEGELPEARQTLDRALEVMSSNSGRHGYFHEANFLTLYCNLSNHLGLARDNLRMTPRMTADPVGLGAFPMLYYQCGARTYEATGDTERAVEMLRALIQHADPQHHALFRVALARNLVELGRFAEARAEIDRVGSNVRDAEIYEQVRTVRAALRGH
jgi:hypothetical protein